MNSQQLKGFWNSFAKFYSENIEADNMQLLLSLSKMLKLNSAKNILEIGCASGDLALYLLQSLPPGTKYTSIDISEEMINIANQKKENMKVKLNDVDHSFLVGDAMDLSSIPDESIDVYMAPLVLHLVPDAKKTLKEAMRVLTKGGRIGFSVKGTDEKNAWNNLLDDALVDGGVSGPMFKNKPTVVLDGTRETLIKMIEESGFKVDYCWHQDIPMALFDEEDVKASVINPKVYELLSTKDEETQKKFHEALRRRFEQTTSNYTPVMGNILFLVGRKL